MFMLKKYIILEQLPIKMYLLDTPFILKYLLPFPNNQASNESHNVWNSHSTSLSSVVQHDDNYKY